MAAPLLIDCRSPGEYASDHIEGSINIPHMEIGDKIASVCPDKNTPIKVWCAAGMRAGCALSTLKSLGYTNVENLGGIGAARRALGK